MASLSKTVSLAVFPLSCLIAAAACVGEVTGDGSVLEAAQADDPSTSTSTSSGASPCSADGGTAQVAALPPGWPGSLFGSPVGYLGYGYPGYIGYTGYLGGYSAYPGYGALGGYLPSTLGGYYSGYPGYGGYGAAYPVGYAGGYGYPGGYLGGYRGYYGYGWPGGLAPVVLTDTSDGGCP